ncbi:MAG: hypothetical protein K8I82_06390, partial [Anaerolineae bacterium]|nr:hypothetical protein [Anaerolineae bacterium]
TSREAARSQQPINFEVLDQLCGGEYQVWSETDAEGNPIFLNAECRAHAAPIGGGIGDLINVNGNVHLNLQGRDAAVQTREDGVIVIDYCVDTTCTRVEIEATCAVTPTDEAEIYQVDCGESDLMVIETVQAYIPGGKTFNNLKQLALP